MKVLTDGRRGCTGEATRVTVHTPYSTVTLGATTTTATATTTRTTATSSETESSSHSHRASTSSSTSRTTTSNSDRTTMTGGFSQTSPSPSPNPNGGYSVGVGVPGSGWGGCFGCCSVVMMNSRCSMVAWSIIYACLMDDNVYPEFLSSTAEEMSHGGWSVRYGVDGDADRGCLLSSG